MKQQTYRHNQKFQFESGEEVEYIDICYHTNIDEQAEREDKKTIWICHALTANSDPTDWWSSLVGSGKLFNTDTHNIICVNMLGSCYGSSGPSSPHPNGKSAQHPSGLYLNSYPTITVRDIVKAHEIIRKKLKIEQIDLLIGGSIGSFQSLEWAISSPKIIKNLIVIAGNARVTPWGSSYGAAQKMAIEADETYHKAESIEGGKRGLEAARAIALISYRSYQGYNQTQSETTDEHNSPLLASRCASYQRYQGKKLSDRFDAYSYSSLTDSVDSHNVGRGRGGVAEALKTIQANTICIGIDSDNLFPPQEQKFIAENIPNAVYQEITSQFGHDGFLLEYKQIEKIVREICKY